MEQEQFTLTDKDLAVIAELTRRAEVSKADGFVSWWSSDRHILWLRLFVTGKPGPWMMVPAADERAAARQREVFAQLVGIQLEINALVVADRPLQ